MPALDVDALRADTPATADLIHLDNAGSSLPPQPVVEAVVDYVRAEAAMGGYRAQEALADRIDDFYAATATMLGCGREEVSFCGGASEAWWRAFTAFPLRPGDRVVAGSSEFQANAFGLLQARDRGVIVEVVPDDDDGVIDLAALGDLLEPPTRLIALTMVSMSNGAVQPAAEVGALARAAGLPYLLDACQAAGQRPLDVDALGCDALVYTGRKFMRGPRGTGVLYVRRSIRDRLGVIPFVDGRSAEWLDDGGWEAHDGSAAFEFGEQHYAGKVGLAVATRYALDTGLERIAARIGALAARFRSGLAELGGVRVLDRGRDRCGIVTFGVDGHTADHVGKRLRDNSINVSTPGRRNAQWDIGARGIDAVVRAGIHCFNTEDEIDRTLDVVASLTSPRC
jgi:cysteine desulfurase/selenocysteine lyase